MHTFLQFFEEQTKRRACKKANPSSQEEEESRRLDPKCWKGYRKKGTKLKDGVRVNNCVKA